MITDAQMGVFLKENPDFMEELPAIMRDFARSRYRVDEGKNAEGCDKAAPASLSRDPTARRPKQSTKMQVQTAVGIPNQKNERQQITSTGY